jgi:hypothetical protein
MKRPWKHTILTVLSTILALLAITAATQAALPDYVIKKTLNVGGEGGFDYVTVQAQVAPPVLTVPVIHIPAPDLSVYDALRAGAAA